MKSSTRSIILAAFMALCLLVMPAFSAPSNQSTSLVLLVQHSGSGFAINGSQYHVLKIGILSITEFDPAKIDELISDNKTLGQIKSDVKNEIKNETDAASYNGSLMLGENLYRLSNISSKTISDNNSTIEADIAGPITLANMNNSTAAVGHISLGFTLHENDLIGQGKLIMNSGNYSGKYNALILMDSEEFNREMGRCRMENWDGNGMASMGIDSTILR